MGLRCLGGGETQSPLAARRRSFPLITARRKYPFTAMLQRPTSGGNRVGTSNRRPSASCSEQAGQWLKFTVNQFEYATPPIVGDPWNCTSTAEKCRTWVAWFAN